jgi:glycerate kinase
MKILVAPNALKGSLDPIEAARAIAEGLARSLPTAELVELPIADGGDGTAAVFVHALGGSFADATAEDPLGRARKVNFGLIGDGHEAVVEVARSSGLALLTAAEYGPMTASSYGAGQLVRAALDRGCRRIALALGGSATVDGGGGLAEALGVRLLDVNGQPVPRGGEGLARLEHIDASDMDPRIAEVDLVAVCDVDNVLLGERGAARTFAPQKGATSEMVDRLEASLSHFAVVIQRELGRDVRGLKHGGAAGGMAAGIAGILGGRLVSGADFVLDRLDIGRRLTGIDVVVTAEGRIDRQTLENKAPYALAREARAAGVFVVALAGDVSDDVHTETFDRFDALVPICPRPMPLEEAMRRAREHLVWAAQRVGQVLALGGRLALCRGLS